MVPRTPGRIAALPAPGFWAGAKLTLFRALEWASEVRSSLRRDPLGGNRVARAGSESVPADALWVFVSTIGELNAIEPFLKLLLADTQPEALVLLTDRKTYRESYLAKYPKAVVHELDGTSRDLVELVRAAPPRLLLIAEIPCMLFDAPCRLPFGAIYALKREGIPVCLVNGWLYGEEPSSNLDRLERALFGGDYLQLLDLVTVQSDAVRDALLEQGADPERVVVTGNTKFDALAAGAWSPRGKRSERILEAMVDPARPCIVAGCVTAFADQRMILEAFARVSARMPDARLVLAPRHPEQKDQMAELEGYLTHAGQRFAFRSRLADGTLPEDLQILILDTMGELRDFYAASTVAHVGRNHNILEPLAYGKPVTITSGWEPRYPSYPVYRLLVEARAVAELDGPDQLATEWLRVLTDGTMRDAVTRAAREAVERLAGASRRNLALMRRDSGLLGRAASARTASNH